MLSKLMEPGPQHLCSCRPQGDGPLLPTLAGQLHEGTDTEADLLALQGGDFGYACPTVIQRQEQRMISPARPFGSVGRCEECLHFRPRQIANQLFVLAL